jgi:hypothetical protein
MFTCESQKLTPTAMVQLMNSGVGLLHGFNKHPVWLLRMCLQMHRQDYESEVVMGVLRECAAVWRQSGFRSLTCPS